MFDITWFWAKDPKGLERLSKADILSLGLREPSLSKIYVQGRPQRLHEPRLSNGKIILSMLYHGRKRGKRDVLMCSVCQIADYD